MIRTIRIQNFRKHVDYTADFLPGTTVITGLNGSGKTSIIEAIYIALQGKSWRSNFAEIMREGANWWRIDVEFVDGEKRTVKYENGEKTFIIDGVIAKTLTAKNKKPVILFEPNDMNLLYGSPARRREFVDRFIAQTNPTHSNNLRKFERVLQQRNNLLKQGASRDDLFVWDIQFADLAEKITIARQQCIKQINAHINQEYTLLSSDDCDVELIYSGAQISKQYILQQLYKEFSQSLLYTNTGPQKEDIKFYINGRDSSKTASRGENRTLLQALKNVEYNTIQIISDNPIVLLDDILSEFDDERQKRLLSHFDKTQVLITCVENKHDIKNISLL